MREGYKSNLQVTLFNELLLEAIEEALSTLGEAPKAQIYLYLEHNFNMPKEQIPTRLEDLSSALDKMFGLGARYLEILFMKNLHAKLKKIYKVETPKLVSTEMTFAQYTRLFEKSLKQAEL